MNNIPQWFNYGGNEHREKKYTFVYSISNIIDG